jgi:fructose-1,6-bisphosphatase/sedoheptulose 1,7-bisphosphatase-like protein
LEEKDLGGHDPNRLKHHRQEEEEEEEEGEEEEEEKKKKKKTKCDIQTWYVNTQDKVSQNHKMLTHVTKCDMLLKVNICDTVCQTITKC